MSEKRSLYRVTTLYGVTAVTAVPNTIGSQQFEEVRGRRQSADKDQIGNLDLAKLGYRLAIR